MLAPKAQRLAERAARGFFIERKACEIGGGELNGELRERRA